MKICIYGASSDRIDPFFMKAAYEFGILLAKKGHSLVFGGGAHGLMGAAARGVTSQGGTILGIAPSFFHTCDILYDQCTDFIYTETMRERKQLMEENADAFVMVPGGFGTFEEFFEILTLKQLGRHQKPIAVLNTLQYFDPMEKLLIHTMDTGFASDACQKLYRFFDDADALLAYLEENPDADIDASHLKYPEK